ncbi:MAG: beta-Ala-His dipeptidase [Pirellula sp.]|nr:beta-Ala-His dipeptidase [Pirellula sp.]
MNPSFPIPEPKVVWNHFFDLVAVPRPSKNEGAAIDHIEQWAKKLGFVAKRDSVNNLCVHVPASKATSAEPVILQCHVDIVSVTEDGNPFGADASAGKIPLERGEVDPKREKRLIPNANGDWINSPYTTLGADNGIGVAMMMALAEKQERSVPLELLFTVDEEAGMTGAIGMNPSQLGLTGKRLVNIDTEDDDEITIGSAGGRDVEVQWNGRWEKLSQSDAPSKWSIVKLKLDGLKGGHSGVEINQGRANANRLVARILNAIQSKSEIRLMDWQGGSRRNAIPDKSVVRFAIATDAVEQAQQTAKAMVESLDRLYSQRDNPIQLHIEVSECSLDAEALSSSDSAAWIRVAQGIPTGICEMTPELPVLVEASCNMAIIELATNKGGRIICSVRGTTPEALSDVSDSIVAIAGLANATTTVADGYPGWKPHLDSPLLQAAVKSYEKLFGETPKVHAIHAGLECGLLVEKLPGLHAISLGPTIKGNHAVGERVCISSVAKSYRYVEAILESLS